MTDKAETELKACNWCAGTKRIGIVSPCSDGAQVDCPKCVRPTQTADAVEALRDCADPMRVLQRSAEKDGAEVNSEAAAIINDASFIRNIAKNALAALSTSADSGDREEVEPVAWRMRFIFPDDGPFNVGEWMLLQSSMEERAAVGNKPAIECQPLYAHPPTPQDSGLADEFNSIIECWHDGQVSSDEAMTKLAVVKDRMATALRQPRNDGELLRDIVDEVRDPNGAGTLPTDIMDRIDAALARLDQGEG